MISVTSYVTFTPNSQQHQAIEHPPAPLMLIAGAGTGKTSTLLQRICHHVVTGSMKPDNIVLLTFTEKATAEAQDKIRGLLKSHADGITVSTFHGFCHSLVRQYSPEKMADWVLWQDSDVIHFFLNHFNDLDDLSSRTFRADPISAIGQAVIPFLSRMKDELISPKELKRLSKPELWTEEWIRGNYPLLHKNSDPEDTANQLRDLAYIYEWFQKAKESEKALDFGDMLLHCHTLLKNNPDVLKTVQKKFRHIFIDEYQDNNYALNKIVNLIAKKHASITAVGDEDQCIYSFRGANYYNIQDFENRYSSHPHFKIVKLVENYRSTQEILDLANASIAHNSNRNEKVLVTPKSRPKDGAPPIWTIAESTGTKEAVPELIQHLTESGRAYHGDIAVICRNWGNVKDIADVLLARGIPVDLHVEKFFRVPMVKNVLAWAHFILNDHTSQQSLFRILSQAVGDGWTEHFFRTTSHASVKEKVVSLAEIANESDTDSIRSEQIIQILNSQSSLLKDLCKKLPAGEMVWAIMKELKQTKLMTAMRRNYRYRERLNLANMGELLNMAEQFANTRSNEKSSLSDWLSFMDAMRIAGDPNAAQPELPKKNVAVQLMTAHQSKGLQFPIVILPFIRQNTFPMSLKRHTVIDRLPAEWMKWGQSVENVRDSHFQEERRVFYVACTRAENRLYIFGPKKSQSDFTKELENLNPPVMEKRIMAKDKNEKNERLSKTQQRLMAELNREITASQYGNARDILAKMVTAESAGTPIVDERDDTSEASRDLLTLSATSIKDYQDCPYKYRLKHRDGVPEQKSKATMEFGNIMHVTLRDFHSLPVEEQTEEKLTELFQSHWREDSFEYRQRAEEFFLQGEEQLEGYFRHFRENPPDVAGCEKRFTFDIDHLAVRIKGQIDRLDRDGDRLRVVDYKTGKSREEAKKNLQMALYSEALRRDAVDDLSGEPGETVLHYLRYPDEPLSSHTFSSEELETYLEKIEDVVGGIRKQQFEPKPNEYGVCKWCDFKEFLCPAWEEE